ncbi:MAG: hypothetical protein IJR49_06620 [Treponema sp.]|nr:hypothetical protein [Treponema sp.]
MKKNLGITFLFLSIFIFAFTSCVSTSLSEKWHSVKSMNELSGTWKYDNPILGATNTNMLVISSSEISETKILDYSIIKDKELIEQLDKAVEINISNGYKTKAGFEKWKSTKKWQGVVSLSVYADQLLSTIKVNEAKTKLLLQKDMIYLKISN